MHRRYLGRFVRDFGCIDRPQEITVVCRSGEIYRPLYGAVNSVVKLMALGNPWMLAKSCVRDQGRTVMSPKLHLSPPD